MNGRFTRSRRQAAGAASALAMFACEGTTLAQPAPGSPLLAPASPYTSGPVTSEPIAFSGADFAGVRFTGAAQTGVIELAAARAFAWSADATTQRLLLRGDVRVRVGLSTFAAARASAWIERLDPAPDGSELHQIAVYFDRVSDPAGQVGVTQAGDRLMVTGVIRGPLSLAADSFASGRPADPFVVEGERRMARLLAALTGADDPAVPPLFPQTGGVRAPSGAPIAPGESQPFEPGSPLGIAGGAAPGSDLVTTDATAWPESPGERLPPIFAAGGFITIAAGEPTLIAGGDEPAIVVTGGVVVQYSETRRDRQLQISAERAVVFLAPGPIADLLRAPADKVRGVYLEGHVIATDGRFTLRGPRVYYDVVVGRAYLVDGVFFTYDQTRGLPIYVRGKAMMQTAANQVKATGVTLANSSFFEPHLSLGATSITVTREAGVASAGSGAGRGGAGGGSGGSGGGGGAGGLGGAGVGRTLVDGENLTLRAGRLPFFYVPRFAGDVERFPLRDVRFENSSNSGLAVKTAWDIFGLLGTDPPAAARAELLIDGYLRRGIGLGAEGGYDLGSSVGAFLGYILPEDDGRDTLTSGAKIDRNGETRGIIAAEHRWSIDEKTTISLEGAYLSDENFVDAFYEPLAETRREFTTSASLRRTDANATLALLAKTNFNDFIANEYLLQSQGYTVEKLPEASYARVADSLFDGLLHYSSSYSLANMGLNFVEKTPAELGFDTPALSQAAFGLNPTDRIDAALRAGGLDQDSVLRFDTRQELSSTFAVGPVNLTPFGVARLTAYDTDFPNLAPAQTDEYRAWFGGGLRAATTVQHIDDAAESRLFDIHRVRHIITPSITGWAAGTNVESSDLPVYDESVENLADGASVRMAIDQTWQTQRGGPGRWRSVDFLTLNAEAVFSTDSTTRKSPIGRFFDYRPEYSVLGDFTTLDAAWQVSDAVGITANEVFDLERNQSSRTTAGGIVQHSADFSSFAEVHFLNARDSTFVSFGAEYRLTRKWTTTLAATYDVDQTDFQELGARLNREFPSAIVSLKLRYNNITDEVALGFVLQPRFADERRVALRRLGRDQLDLGEIPFDAMIPGEQSGTRGIAPPPSTPSTPSGGSFP